MFLQHARDVEHPPVRIRTFLAPPLALVGLAIMIVSECATLAHVEPFWSWNTPICWTGFIVYADAVVRRARGESWLTSNRREFAFLAVVSIPLWVVFEGYNVIIRNWYYVGLPDNLALRYLGYCWAFATISPALFEGAELISVLRHAKVDRSPESLNESGPDTAIRPFPFFWRCASIAAGIVMLTSPFVVSADVARYLAAPVWLGFIFLLDPLNGALGLQSISGDWRHGRTDRLVNLLWSGALCGILWEFWNYWSRSKWHYTVPAMPGLKIFEMPLPGYLGFPPFAVECFAMYVFVRAAIGRRIPFKAPPGPSELSREVGL